MCGASAERIPPGNTWTSASAAEESAQ